MTHFNLRPRLNHAAPLLMAGALAVLAGCAPPAAKKTEAPAAPASAPAAAATAGKPAMPQVPAGDYTLDKSHASLSFTVNHLGFSHYTARFADFDAKLKFDPANPTASTIEATIDPRSLDLPTPPAGFKTELTGPQWLDAAKYPTITFRSTKVEVTGANTAKITGDFTLHGVTKPVVLEATFNGGYAGHPMDPHARIGFSARGVFKRADFGIGFGVPAAGSTMGVSDQVDVTIETEFSGPPLATAPAAAPAAPAT
jgi:polyisoprenoid-binding protein YceI